MTERHDLGRTYQLQPTWKDTEMIQDCNIRIDHDVQTATATFTDTGDVEPFIIRIEPELEDMEGQVLTIRDSSGSDPVYCYSWQEAWTEFKRTAAAFITDDWGEPHD